MKQDIERQYDDDLTLGTDEYDDSYYTDADDLFELSTNDESPISRLKSLVLSIDWEITDEVLLQFNEELMDLKGIWAGDSINLVYVQALEKISKYIYQNKADSHPNSIKLLLTLYYNLEKIVSSEDLSESQKKEILIEDVKKFEALKRQISQQAQPAAKPSTPVRPEAVEVKKEVAHEDKLLNLKAIVLGIDWEITDQDLNDLRQEVIRLEEQFAGSRPKLILLQGIGTLGAYIKMKKSNAHADAFKVLHLFYESLEKIVRTPMSLEEEKTILFPAVEKFNAFKSLLGPTISPEAIGRKEEDEDEEEDEEYADSGSGEIAPAFADIPEEEVMGFQADEEAKSLGIDGTDKVASHIDDFFGETFGVPAEEAQPLAPSETDESLEEKEILAVLGFEEEETALSAVDKDIALQGVEVEADDEEVAEPIVTAFAAGEDDAVAAVRGGVSEEDAAESFLSTLEDELPAGIPSSDEEVARVTEAIFAEDEAPSMKASYGEVDRSAALQGVDVETEADEDSDEVSLPMEGEELAPALMTSDEESIFSAKTLESTVASGGIDDELVGTLDELFLEEEQEAAYRPEEPVAEADFSGEIDREEDLVEEIVEVASLPDESSEELSIFEAIGVTGEVQGEISEAESVTKPTDIEAERAEEILSLEKQEEELDLFAEDSDFEPSIEESREVDTFFESLEPVIDEEEVEEPAELEIEAEPVEPEIEVELAEPEIEEEVAAPEVEERIDALFALEEVAAEAAEERIAVTQGEEAESVGVEGLALSYPAAEEAEEEEVVFELAEEPVGEPVEAPSISIEPALEAAAAEEPEFDWSEETAESIAPVFAGEESEDSGLEFAATESADGVPEMVADPLGGLRGCIESLGIELDDKVINGLFQEINGLRQKWSDRPLEKTFLQLLSTVTQHIDQYRFESSSEAFNLLQSVATALTDSRDKDIHSCQELLLAETLKVLAWQQGMLARQAVQKGGQLTFVAPVRTEGEDVQGVSDAQEDFDQQLQHYGETVEDVTLATDERNWPEEQAVFPIEESEPDIAAAGKVLFAQKAELSREAFAEELKQEIASLRQTLQKEIAELRSELKGM